MTKLLTLLYEVKTMRIIIQTIKSLTGPFSLLVTLMVMMMYQFALIGMFIWGGDVT